MILVRVHTFRTSAARPAKRSKQLTTLPLQYQTPDLRHQVAVTELERVRAGYEEERLRREAELRDRHQVATLRRQMRDRADRRSKTEVSGRVREQLYNCN